MKNVLFVGAGSMAEAIIAGITSNGAVEPASVFVMNKSDHARLEELRDKYGITPVRSGDPEIGQAELALFATKPKDARQAMKEIAGQLHPSAAVLSVMAGIPISLFEEGLGSRPVARSMPNTSATIGLAATGVAMNDAVGDKVRQDVLSLLGSIGLVKEVEEDELHLITALAGSGPAYVYYFAEALEEAATASGLCGPDARDLIVQVLEGAAAMLKRRTAEPAELREHVTSPGGTTAAGIRALDDAGFREAVASCIRAAENRSRELASGQ
ncbi:pyrroline-5-carboxylate reductase [Bhargavaea ginsengi]|uniref:Pyrroline-5-carboxylate reductase n=1 Tax=Bhargavaea ginsengi TaxID=426757 RepID=A0A1H6X1L4_9BACL|nr:pyrroline-5-carboxylate reductase [Bhargavaea ginsengi]MCM3088688.1 pyrroline-5-carboxylate reductase [Bhargavaea ginsengi]SEJ18455.1 pyrroline-5-carboxylate reductase [Bhargavaea ginsengi]